MSFRFRARPAARTINGTSGHSPRAAMTDTAHPTPPPKIAIGRANAPTSAHRPDEVHFDRIFGMASTVKPAGAAHEGRVRVNVLASNFALEEYRIERALGAGGFGVTHKAWDTLLETRAVIKEYFPVEWAYRDADGVTVNANIQGNTREERDNLTNYSRGLERFLDEARVLARVQHPFVVRVKRYFRAHGTAYIVMDYEGAAERFSPPGHQAVQPVRRAHDHRGDPDRFREGGPAPSRTPGSLPPAYRPQRPLRSLADVYALGRCCTAA